MRNTKTILFTLSLLLTNSFSLPMHIGVSNKINKTKNSDADNKLVNKLKAEDICYENLHTLKKFFMATPAVAIGLLGTMYATSNDAINKNYVIGVGLLTLTSLTGIYVSDWIQQFYRVTPFEKWYEKQLYRTIEDAAWLVTNLSNQEKDKLLKKVDVKQYQFQSFIFQTVVHPELKAKRRRNEL